MGENLQQLYSQLSKEDGEPPALKGFHLPTFLSLESITFWLNKAKNRTLTINECEQVAKEYKKILQSHVEKLHTVEDDSVVASGIVKEVHRLCNELVNFLSERAEIVGSKPKDVIDCWAMQALFRRSFGFELTSFS